MALAVAAILSPTIAEAVERVVAAGISQLCKELGEQARRLSEVEHRLSDLEDELQTSFTNDAKSAQTQQYLLDKIDDLENRSFRNNLRIIGLPESFKAVLISEICSLRIPQALGISSACTIERAHRLGSPSNDHRSQRPFIVWYLNYADRLAILKSFKNGKSLHPRWQQPPVIHQLLSRGGL